MGRLSAERGAPSRDALAERGVHSERADFAAALEAPSDGRLAVLLGVDAGRPLVYVAQQVCADYPATVSAKFAAARDLAAGAGVAVAVLWHDMDRAGSDKLALRFVLPSGSERIGVALAPRSAKDREPRFIGLERERLDEAVSHLEEWIARAEGEGDLGAPERAAKLAQALRAEGVDTLADANRALATVLLRDGVGLEAPGAFTSEILAAGLLNPAMNALLADLDGVVAEFNRALEELYAAGIDPGVRPLTDDYLPLRYSCERDNVRIRLARAAEGGREVAVGTCRCGVEYRFSLGGESALLGELEESERWSPDITLPVLLNDLVSGVVAGRSSGVYGLVLNAVTSRVLGGRPVPMLLPPGLEGPVAEGGATLLHDYLTG